MMNLMLRFGHGWCLALVAVGCLLAQTNANADQPNILMILVDDLGYGDLSSYGARDLRSPHVDAMASQGLKFTNFYANCPVCSPTRASLMSGRFPELVGVPGVIRTHPENSWGYLQPQSTLLPKVLAKAGYKTGMVGKWHLGLEAPNRPNDRGYQWFRGYLGDMMDDYYNHRRHGINYMRSDLDEIDPEGHATDLFTSWTIDFLKAQKADQPFFLYLAYNAPHTPIQPPSDWLEKVKSRETGIGEKRARLVALIEHMDAGIGQVMETLQSTGLADNTLVIFSSDNGGQLNVGANNGDTRDGKQSVYEGGLKVPTVVVWPGRISAGTTTDRIGITMDLFPTICEAANAPFDHEIDGISLMPTLLGKAQNTANRDLFFHRREGGNRYGGLTINAIRRGDWKLLQNSPFAPLELYNLTNDPLEQTDLAKKEPKVFNALSQALRIQIQRGGAVPWQPPQRRSVQH